MFDLWEGNHISHLEADSVFGGSSHIVYFRNWLRGGESEIDLPDSPNCGFAGLDVRGGGWYHAAVGNVLGEPDWTTGSVLVSPATDCSPGIYGGQRRAYFVGCNPTDATAAGTLIKHGNYDYLTQGVAYWDGGADHVLRGSMYYDAPPAWWDCRPWPIIGPDLEPVAQDIPAKDRFEGEAYTCPDQTCSQQGGTCCPIGQECAGGAFSTSADCGARCCLAGSCREPEPPDAGATSDGDGSLDGDGDATADGDGPQDADADAGVEPADPGDPGTRVDGGCGCTTAHGGSSPAPWILAALAMLLRRRHSTR